MKDIKLKIPSISKNIRIVESFIDNVKSKFDLNDDIYGNIMIAITDAVNNAIIHGNKENPEKNVFIVLSLDENQISFCIEDEGNGFNYKELPDPTSQENMNKTSGRGVFIMKNLSDELTFENNGSKVKLVFYI